MNHSDLLKLLLPASLDPNGERLGAELAAEGRALDAALGRASALLDESDPRSTVHLLTDWEGVAGLPDEGELLPTTVQERRNSVVARVTGIGGQSRAYFIALGTSLGYEVTITEFRPFRAGQSAAGDPVNSAEWVFVWRVNAPQTTITSFRAGQSAAGEPIRRWGNEALERVMGRLKPAHTRLLFGYGAANYVDEDYIDSGYFD